MCCSKIQHTIHVLYITNTQTQTCHIVNIFKCIVNVIVISCKKNESDKKSPSERQKKKIADAGMYS